jgi:glycosyltransferase involved in cell wall biosynthesis
LRLGSGTRLKALEALAAGRPVVGTSIGLEGLDLVDGQHALVADDPQAFATAILRMLGDDQLAAGLVAAGRRLVEDRYSWSHIADTFAEAIIGNGGGERRV